MLLGSSNEHFTHVAEILSKMHDANAQISGCHPRHILMLRDRIIRLRSKESGTQRIMIAFAGTPGSGKSTISAELLACLRQQYIEDVAVVPMVGCHPVLLENGF